MYIFFPNNPPAASSFLELLCSKGRALMKTGDHVFCRLSRITRHLKVHTTTHLEEREYTTETPVKSAWEEEKGDNKKLNKLQ